MIISFLLHIIANATAILVSAWLIPNVFYQYEFFSLIKIAAMFAVANSLIKPILKIVFSPLILVTLGTFTLIINIFLIWLVTYFASELYIVGLSAYFLVMIIVSFFNFIVSAFKN
ncbi:MAG: phage holin family protein [Patescibacteria group bacterium]